MDSGEGMGEVVPVVAVGTSVCSSGDQSSVEDGFLVATSMTRCVSRTLPRSCRMRASSNAVSPVTPLQINLLTGHLACRANKKRRHPVAKVKGSWTEEEDERLVRYVTFVQYTPPVTGTNPTCVCEVLQGKLLYGQCLLSDQPDDCSIHIFLL